MKKRRIALVTAILTVLVLCFETAAVSAASLSEIRKNIQEKQEELEEGRAQEQSLADQVSELEANINKLETAIAEGEQNLAVLEQELAEAEEKVETQNDNLNARLRNMYKSGSVGFIDVLLDSSSLSEFLTNLDMVEMIYSSDQEVLAGLQDAYDEVDKKKQEVETLQAELETSKATAEEQQAEVNAKKEEIAASNEETEEMLNKLEAQAQALTATIVDKGSSSSDSTYTGGEMAWPAPSYTRISQYYGWRIHPITGRSNFHGAIDLAAPGGSPIVAANPGTVIIATYNSSYGYYVVVDHGGGVTTLYAHSSRLRVSVGQSVSRGQRIADVGTTGSSTGNHLHFEVRINGNRVNPLPYIT